MTKYNMNVVSSDMKGRLEFMMNIYNSLMMTDVDKSNKTSDNRSLNGYIKLMKCATNSKKQKKSNKFRSCWSSTSNKTITSAVQKNYSR